MSDLEEAYKLVLEQKTKYPSCFYVDVPFVGKDGKCERLSVLTDKGKQLLKEVVDIIRYEDDEI